MLHVIYKKNQGQLIYLLEVRTKVKQRVAQINTNSSKAHVSKSTESKKLMYVKENTLSNVGYELFSRISCSTETHRKTHQNI